MGILDSLLGGGGGQKSEPNRYAQTMLGLPLAFLGSKYIKNFDPGKYMSASELSRQIAKMGENRDYLIPYETYPTEDRFAATPEQFTQAADYSMSGSRDPWSAGFDRAGQLFDQGATFNPSRIQDYENQYSGDIIDEVFRLGNENLFENILPGVNTTFTGAGQFGSSRHEDFTNRAVRDTQREALGQASNILFQSRDNAMDQYALERNRDIAAGEGWASIPGQASVADTNYINNLLRTGEIMRGEEQQALDFDYNTWLKQQNQAQDFMSMWMTGAVPAAQTGTITETQGARTSILGALGGIGGAAAGAWMASDVRVKNIGRKLGQFPSGINVYEFTFKNDPNTTHTGVIAQEVQKVIPSAVKDIDGILHVNYGELIDG